MSEFTRRTLIRSAALVPLAAKVGCVRRIDTNRELTVAAAVDGDITVPVTQAPELSAPGGAVVVQSPGTAGRFLVAHTGTGYVALSAECPHEGCLVAWVQEDLQAECPCHGSRFAGDGTLLNPPAISNLNSYPAEVDAQGNVVVHLFAGDGTFSGRVENGQFSFAIADFPALANVNGVILGRPDGFPSTLLITRVQAGTGPDAIAAMSAVCPHLGCTVLPGTASPLQCPCHDSRFSLTGIFLEGPAAVNLLRYAVSFDGTTVTISTNLRS